jgi:hypothetical protein
MEIHLPYPSGESSSLAVLIVNGAGSSQSFHLMTCSPVQLFTALFHVEHSR